MSAANPVLAGQLQIGWRSCSKCQGTYFGGFHDNAGKCPAGGAHDAAGNFKYAMRHDVPAAPDARDQFTSCSKCQQLFYGPFGGKCPATGAAHNPANSFNYTFEETKATACILAGRLMPKLRIPVSILSSLQFEGVPDGSANGGKL